MELKIKKSKFDVTSSIGMSPMLGSELEELKFFFALLGHNSILRNIRFRRSEKDLQ